MGNFTPTTGHLSYSALLLPKTTTGSFSLGMEKTRQVGAGFKYIQLQQTGSSVGFGQSYGAYSVEIINENSFFANPEENYVAIYGNLSGNDSPHFTLSNYISGTGSILSSKARFGDAIAVNSNFLIVGAPYYADNSISGGQVYIFQRANTYGLGVSGENNWGLYKGLTGTQSGNDTSTIASGLGTSVDILTTTPADRIAVGAPLENASHGAVYIFSTEGGLQNKLTPPVAQSGHYGQNVKLINSMELFDNLGVGEYTATKTGEVHIYQSTKNSATSLNTGFNAWGLLQTLTSPNAESGDFFGCSLGSNNEYFIIGSPCESSGRGCVYIYNYSEDYNLWKPYQSLQPTNLANDNKFGKSLAFDGTTLAIGSNFNSGCVHIYQEPSEQEGFEQISLVSGLSPIPSGAFGGNETGAHGIAIDDNKMVVGTSQGSDFYFYYTGSGLESPFYECFSISGISGKIIDNDGNYVFGYNISEKIKISGNVFPDYHNYHINDY